MTPLTGGGGGKGGGGGGGLGPGVRGGGGGGGARGGGGGGGYEVFGSLGGNSASMLSLCMGWLQILGSLKLQVSFAEYSLFYRAVLQRDL